MDQITTDLSLSPELPDLLLSHSTGVLLEEFGAGRASPGSGSAAALMGLLSVKLLQTVCVISRVKHPDRATLYQFVEVQIGLAEPQLRSLFEEDAKEFDRVVAIRRARDAATVASEKVLLSRQANEKLELATDFALDISELCLQVLVMALQIFGEGWRPVRGDSGAAISAASAGAMSGIFIANLNLKSLGGRNYALSAKNRCDELFTRVQALQAQIFSCMTMINQEATAALKEDLQLSLNL